jgi:soluble cytochrome b562
MEKFGSINRVIGQMPEEEKADILEEMKRRFNDQSFLQEDISSREKEKTPEHEEIIALADKLTNELLHKYGLPALTVPAGNIHIIHRKKWWPNIKLAGFYSSLLQTIAVKDEDFKLSLFNMIVHELMHMKSYNAIQLKRGFDDDTEVKDYRSGLETLARDIDVDEHYFKLINEAITESLTIEVFNRAKTDPMFAIELADSKNINHSLPLHDVHKNPDTYYVREERMYPDGQEGNEEQVLIHKISTSHSYQRERQVLNILIDKIKEHHPEYKDRQEIFNLFAQAALQGNMMPLARVIEGTFGRGTFRSLGECTDVKEMIKIVNSLK